MTTEPAIDPNTPRELEKARGDLKTLRAELQAARAERDTIRAERDDAIKSRDGLKAQFDKQKTEFEGKLADATAAATKAQADAVEAGKAAKAQANAAVIRAEAKAAATRLGAVAPEDVVKLIDLGSVKMGENGEIEGLDAVMSAAKEARGYLFSEPPKPGTETGTTKAPAAPQAREPGPLNARTLSDEDYAKQKQQFLNG
ncbi:phage minor structual protein GP20 [Acetobacter orientalis]|uniref:Phage minor structual protein GP20 n=1 Tax=Acetobacter orientalis TaxID=146474 RepID=A0A2Z5ZL85_9PROT|nr:phage minor structual protein GP20 [Acetobacter orientalis]